MDQSLACAPASSVPTLPLWRITHRGMAIALGSGKIGVSWLFARRGPSVPQRCKKQSKTALAGHLTEEGCPCRAASFVIHPDREWDE